MRIYHLGGRLFESVTHLLTWGRVDRFKSELVEKLGVRPGDRVLDWGCGTGAGARKVLPLMNGRGEIHGVEIAPNMLKLAVARSQPSPDLKFSYTLRNGFDLTLAEPADVALAWHTLGVLPGDLSARGVEEIWMNLRSGGRVLVTDMYLPETKTRWGAIRKSVARFVARNFYHQNFGGSVLPNLERYFETVEILHRPNLMAYAFLGRRRDEPLEALRTS